MMDLEWLLTFQKRLIGLSIIFLDKIKTTLKVNEDALVENPQKITVKRNQWGFLVALNQIQNVVNYLEHVLNLMEKYISSPLVL